MASEKTVQPETLRYSADAGNAELSALCGPLDENLRQIETILNVRVSRRGDVFRVTGELEAARRAVTALAALMTRVKSTGEELSVDDIQWHFVGHDDEYRSGAASDPEGAVDDVDIALGCHVRPIQDIPTGTCAAAVRHTSSTFADIVIHGRTAHASRPHLGVNCAEVAAAVTQAVAAIKGDPAKVWSCKVTSIQACAAAVNIIPDTATLKLDIRAQTNELMDELLEKVRMAAAGTAAAYGATAEVILPGVVIPAAVYDEDLVAELAGTIREVLGDECLARDCGGGGEDFHFFKKERPHIRAAYFGVGAGCTPGLHARNMTFDETQLDMGVRVLTAAALKHVG